MPETPMTAEEMRYLEGIATEHPYPLLFATVSGAHLYGFPSPDSDYDLRGVHLLPLKELVGLKTGEETISIERLDGRWELDLVTHDAMKFFRLMLKANGYVQEQIMSPIVVRTSPEHEELKEIAKTCLTRHHMNHYFGFAQNQWKLFSKEPKVKALLYTYRVLLTGIHLMREGAVEANLVTLNALYKEAGVDELIHRKKTEHERTLMSEDDVERYRGVYTRLLAQLEDESKRTALPDDAGVAGERLHELLVRLRLAS